MRLKGKCLRSFVHFKTSFHTTDTKFASKVVWGLYIYTNPITGKIMFMKYIGSTRVSCCWHKIVWIMDMNINFNRKWKFQLEHWLNDFVVFNTIFNNISVISWRSVLLVEGPGTIDLSQVVDKLYHIMLNTSPWW